MLGCRLLGKFMSRLTGGQKKELIDYKAPKAKIQDSDHNLVKPR